MAPLVYDVGMCDGTDTARYLELGCRVVAIEAISHLCDLAKERFADAIAAGQLVVLNVAIAPERGPIHFWINRTKDGWSSIYENLGSRGDGGELIETQGELFETILIRYGMPYYLKVDIEGADHLCLEALAKFDDKPQFVSIEAARPLEWLQMLYDLGYRRFAIVNQAPFNATDIDPDLPERSGPFPDNIEGWVDMEIARQLLLTNDGESWDDIYAAW